MPYETESESRRSMGPALARALVGALLGGALIFGVGQAMHQTDIPEATQQVAQQDALLGGTEYGER